MAQRAANAGKDPPCPGVSCRSPLSCCWLRASRRHSALAANSADFTLKNQTGCQIDEVYVSAQSSNNWGKDVMGKDTLDAGDPLKITLSS